MHRLIALLVAVGLCWTVPALAEESGDDGPSLSMSAPELGEGQASPALPNVPSAPPAENAAALIAQARALFDRYVALERAYDPAVADLYSEVAVIRNTRRYPDGQVRTAEIPVEQYTALIRSAMPAAKARGDRSEYSDVAYSAEDDQVRITATRFSALKQYSSPFELLVGPGPDGQWVIFEEISESRP